MIYNQTDGHSNYKTKKTRKMTSETGISSFPESIYDEEPADNIEFRNNKSESSYRHATKRIPKYSPHIMLQHAWHMYALQQLQAMTKTKKSNKNEIIIIDDGEKQDMDTTKIHEKISKKPSEQEPVQLLSQLLGHKSAPCTKGVTVKSSKIFIPPLANETETPVPSGKVQEDCHKNKSKYGIRYKLYSCEHCDVKFQNIFNYEKHLIRSVFKLVLMIKSISSSLLAIESI